MYSTSVFEVRLFSYKLFFGGGVGKPPGYLHCYQFPASLQSPAKLVVKILPFPFFRTLPWYETFLTICPRQDPWPLTLVCSRFTNVNMVISSANIDLIIQVILVSRPLLHFLRYHLNLFELHPKTVTTVDSNPHIRGFSEGWGFVLMLCPCYTNTPSVPPVGQ